MNNRIMAALLALTLCLCLFIGVAPVDAEATDCAHPERSVFQAKEPTCDQKGNYEFYACTSCGARFRTADSKNPIGDWTELDRAPLGHDLEWVTEDGMHLQKCQRTGCSAKRNEHAADLDTPTVNENGTHTRACKNSVCEIVVTEEHVFGADCACGTCGYTNHTKGTEWQTNEGNTHHWYACTKCGTGVESEEHTYELRHDEVGHMDVCTKCGAQGVRVEHNYVLTEQTAAEHIYTCSVCSRVSKDNHYDEDKDCHCDTCTVELEHTYGDPAPCGDDKGHESKCTVCRKSKGDYALCEYETTYIGLVNGQPAHKQICKVCGRGEDGALDNYCYDNDGDCVCDVCENPIPHVWDDTTKGHKHSPKLDPTCTETGKVSFKVCGVCGQYFLPDGTIVTAEQVVVPATDHSYIWGGEGEYVYNEQHYQYCETCGNRDYYADHEFAITDNGDGTHELYCATCGYVGDVYCSDIPDDGQCVCVCGHFMKHTTADMKRVAYKAPTCTEDGVRKHYLCEECGSKFWIADTTQTEYTTPTAEADLVLEKLGHDWACVKTLAGQHDLKCQRVGCNVVERRVDHIDEDGDCLCDVVLEATKGGEVCGEPLHIHHYEKVEGKAPTCQEDGFEAYWIYPECGRMFTDSTFRTELEAPVVIEKLDDCVAGDWESLDADDHVQYCIYCEEVVATEAHEDENGDNRCDTCGVELTLEYVAEVPATCLTAGTRAYWVSTLTNRKYWDEAGNDWISGNEQSDLIIPALGHDWTNVFPYDEDEHIQDCTRCDATNTLPHTADATGCTCADCGDSMPGHNLRLVNYKGATCTSNGVQRHLVCDECGLLYSVNTGAILDAEDVVILAEGHVWSNLKNAGANHYRQCNICRVKVYTNHVVAVEDPMKGNYHQYLCACGDIETEAHFDANGDSKCDKCAHDMSGRTVVVTQHDSQKVQAGNPATVNPFYTWWRNFLENMAPSNSGSPVAPAAAPAAATAEEPTPETPVTQTPTTREPVTQTRTPETQTPATQAPVTQAPTDTQVTVETQSTGIINQIILMISQLLSQFFA